MNNENYLLCICGHRADLHPLEICIGLQLKDGILINCQCKKFKDDGSDGRGWLQNLAFMKTEKDA